jgi:hypothetical protein
MTTKTIKRVSVTHRMSNDEAVRFVGEGSDRICGFSPTAFLIYPENL